MIALDGEALRAAHRRIRGQLAPDWPVARTEQALEALLAAGLPDTRTEAWRYTDLTPLAARLAGSSSSSSAGPAGSVEGSAGPADRDLEILLAGLRLPGPTLEILDGVPAAIATGLPAGLTLADAAATLAVATPGPALTDLNTAFAPGVLALELAAGSTPDGALLLRDRASTTAGVAQPRFQLTLGAGSQLTLVQVLTGADGSWANSVSRFRLDRGAGLTLVRVLAGASSARRFDRTELELGPDATANLTVVDLGSALTRQDLAINLAGTGASVDVGGLCLATPGAHLDHQLTITHAVPRATSRTVYRNVAAAGGRAILNGRIVVAAGAAGSDAALTNRNLLLGPGAEVDTKPELEIYTDDVRCSHGATTGQLDNDALFYLRSRGLPEGMARRVLIGAFCGEVLARLPDPLRTPLGAAVDRVLVDP